MDQGYFSKNYNEKSDKGYFLEVDNKYTENLHKLHNDLSFLAEIMKIENVKKTEYVMHIRNLKPALNHGLVLKKVHKMIKFNKNARLKPCIDMNKDQRKKAKHDFHE